MACADFDGDGDLDLSIANNHETGGTHHLYSNLLDAGAAARSLQVVAVDATGGGYCSQGAAPAHFGLPPGVERVDVRAPGASLPRLRKTEGNSTGGDQPQKSTVRESGTAPKRGP